MNNRIVIQKNSNKHFHSRQSFLRQPASEPNYPYGHLRIFEIRCDYSYNILSYHHFFSRNKFGFANINTNKVSVQALHDVLDSFVVMIIYDRKRTLSPNNYSNISKAGMRILIMTVINNPMGLRSLTPATWCSPSGAPCLPS